MRPDAFRILSVATIVTIAALTVHLMRKNSIADRFIEAQKREYAANIKAEHERKLEAQRMMAESQPKRSKNDCAKSLRTWDEITSRFPKQRRASRPGFSKSNREVISSWILSAIQTKRSQLLKENQNQTPALYPNGIIGFLVCEKNLTWLDGSYIPVPLEYEPGRSCKPGEERLYSMFGCPLEMIQQLPGPF